MGAGKRRVACAGVPPNGCALRVERGGVCNGRRSRKVDLSVIMGLP